ncbi:hypothetical protein HPT25_07270 [Bacillus sp. BRMEA1]|nr:hypothetical protein [Neobacillus endophyticus]
MTEVGINDRVALCLAYTERTLDYFRDEFKDGKYDAAFDKFDNIIKLGFDWLIGNKVDWEIIYNLCNDDEQEYGCFNFVSSHECSDKYTIPTSILIWTIYYLIYQCARQSNEQYFPSDLWDGNLPEEEEKEILETLNAEASKYLSSDVIEQLKLVESIYRKNLYG